MSDSIQPSGCLSLGFLARVLRGSPGPRSMAGDESLPRVIVNRYFISDGERAAMHMLRKAVGDRGYVLSQVSLNRLVWFPPTNGDKQAISLRAKWENKVAKRSIDFVVCTTDSLAPVVAIELDDRSHEREKRRARDRDVERILDAAGLPLERIRAGAGVNVGTFEAIVNKHLMK